ncbi:DNA-3-methyladenine glycosylase 2 family protein [Halolamina sp. CBA1230]|uniref:DNA-3-methyladenine glycosylase family protein n=1 Tax=Halolamina sp. CBA1230 TaxID=1853690 RepID=UPI0009A1AF57|nr:DNA-3-methyladenine glycosylase [Halolamina sp. CBA1230]QKY20108.1 DNA-3-methyladenine glycosylase 2 family protein [Halolamina sp. CBA1230]
MAADDLTDEDAYDRLREDEYLGPIVAEVGPVSIDPAEDAFERLIVSILRQQVSMASAAATRERLFDAVEVTPAGIRAADDETLRDAGLSRQKTRYVNEIADRFAEEAWSREAFAAMEDDEVREALTDITGVGPWTADMFLLFVLGRPDVFPVGDLGVREGLKTLVDHHGENPEMTRGEMTAFAERWEPVRSYAALYLWQVEEELGERAGDVIGE